MGLLDDGVKYLFRGLNLHLLVPLTLLFLGMRSFLVSEKVTFASWYDYFWFAFSTLVMLNRKWLEEPPEA